MKRKSMLDLVGAQPGKADEPDKSPQAESGEHGRLIAERNDADRVIGISLALRQSEYDELQAVADQYGASRGSLMTVLMRHAMRDLRAGKIPLKKRGIRFID